VPIDAERSTAVVEQGSEDWPRRYQTVFTRMAAMRLPFVGPQYPHGEPCMPWPAELPRDGKNSISFDASEYERAMPSRSGDQVITVA